MLKMDKHELELMIKELLAEILELKDKNKSLELKLAMAIKQRNYNISDVDELEKNDIINSYNRVINTL
jgi:hypothetical protein